MVESVRSALEQAHRHVDEDKPAEALEVLLEAWRTKRAPEIADLIDRVAGRLGGEPIEGKTVKERGEKWLAIARKRQAADLGPLLATPWPGTWKNALPWLQAIVAFPLDPRLALALAKIVDLTPYDSWTSYRFYEPLFNYLDKSLDIRTLPILEAQATRKKSSYWRQSTGLRETASVAKLKRSYPDGAPQLEADERAAAQALADLFADDIKAERAKARGEADFLEDIYANPSDLAARQVFADWLTERGDPRGELITIQLARLEGRSTDAASRREASLLKKHGKAWAGALDRVLSKDDRVFECGFLAECTMKLEGYPDKAPAEMSDPAWATVHTMELPWNVTRQREVFAGVLAALPNLRALRGLDEDSLGVLLDGAPRPQIEELAVSFTQRTEPSPERDKMLENTVTLPSLKHVTFSSSPSDIMSIASSALMRGVTRMIVSGGDLGPVAKRLSSLKGRRAPLDELGVVLWSYRSSRWVLVLRKDDDGRFTRLRCEIRGASSVPSRTHLDAALGSLDADALTELVIDKVRVCDYNEEDITILEKRIASFPRLTKIDVPWERLTRASNGAATPLLLRAHGEAHAFPVESIVEHVTRAPLSLTFDSYAVNDAKHVALPKEWRAKIVEVMKRVRTRSVDVYRKGASETSKLRLTARSAEISFGWPKNADDAHAEGVLASVRELFDARPEITGATLNFLPPEAPVDPEDLDRGLSYREMPLGGVRLGWLTLIGPEHASYLDFDDLAKLPNRPGLEWVRTWRPTHKATLLLVAGSSPREPLTASRREQLVIELWKNLWRARKRMIGFVPHELVREELGPVMSELGFREVELTPMQQAEGRLQFKTDKYPRPCALDVEVKFSIYPQRTSFWFRALRALDATVSGALSQVRAETYWLNLRKDGATDAKDVKRMIEEVKDSLTKTSLVTQHWQGAPAQ